jgi:hypothetical protein
MGITNLAAWLGIAVTPLNILYANNFANAHIIFAGLLLGVALIAMAWFSKQRNIKAHFDFTYINFGMNILFIACLAGMIHFDDYYPLWLIPLAAVVLYFYKRSLATRSFYFMLMLTLYGYIGISYALLRVVETGIIEDMGFIYIILMYFIGTGVGLSVFLIRMNKKLKLNDRI